MKQTKDKWSHILRNQAIGFSFLIFLSWLVEITRVLHYIFGESFNPSWHRAILRTVMILLIWSWVHAVTKRLLKRLHYLEDFIRMCGWCRKVNHEGQWVTLEKYLSSKYAMNTTHGMCPDCVKGTVEEIKQSNPVVPP